MDSREENLERALLAAPETSGSKFRVRQILKAFLGVESTDRRKGLWAACRQRLWWRARVRAAEGEASRLRHRLSGLEQQKGE